MLTLRPAAERGRTVLDWLDSRHSFSFGAYHDPAHTGFSVLRVINDDRIAPGAGFAMHGHRDMEIISYVLDGALEHKDSLGNGSVIRPGEVQRMSAGTGIIHSEYNPSASAPAHFLQIWIMPQRSGMPPGYQQMGIAPPDAARPFTLLASPDGRDGSLTLQQDARISLARLQPQQRAVYHLAQGRKAYLHLARGALSVNGQALEGGDGALLEQEPDAQMIAREVCELLLFDLP